MSSVRGGVDVGIDGTVEGVDGVDGRVDGIDGRVNGRVDGVDGRVDGNKVEGTHDKKELVKMRSVLLSSALGMVREGESVLFDVWVCACVCVFVCIHICVCVCVYIYIYIYIYVFMPKREVCCCVLLWSFLEGIYEK
jgi:hypothetical protein